MEDYKKTMLLASHRTIDKNANISWILQETERSSQWTDNLGNQSVQIGVSRTLDIQVPAANIVKSFVVVHDGHIGVLQQWMHTQDLNEEM